MDVATSTVDGMPFATSCVVLATSSLALSTPSIGLLLSRDRVSDGGFVLFLLGSLTSGIDASYAEDTQNQTNPEENYIPMLSGTIYKGGILEIKNTFASTISRDASTFCNLLSNAMNFVSQFAINLFKNVTVFTIK